MTQAGSADRQQGRDRKRNQDCYRTLAATSRSVSQARGDGKATAFAGERLVGHQQATDAYLQGLAVRHGGALATLDQRIAALAVPGSPERMALVIVN